MALLACAIHTLKCKAVDVCSGDLDWERELHVQVVRCSFVDCEHFTHFCGTMLLDFVAYNYNSGYSLNGLRYCKKEFLLGCNSDNTYGVPHLTCQPINCILKDALTAKRIDLSVGSLASSSPAMLGSNECMKYQHGDGHTLSGILDSSNLFTMTCLDGDHTMTHCNPVQCGVPPVIAYATPLGGCFVTITYGQQVEYQREAGYHVESERKSGSKPEGCHAKERAEPEQPVQAPEEPVSAVSSCGHVAPLEERFASWIGQHDRPFPSHDWLEDWCRARCDEMSHWAVLVMGPPGTGKTAGVRLLAGLREVERRKLTELILRGQGGLRQDVTDELKWRLSKAAQELQIPLIFVSDVTARDELVQKCLCSEVRYESHNVEQSLRRVTQRNGLNMPEACLSIAIACGHDVCKANNAAQLMGQRSSSSKLPTAGLSAAASLHILLPSNATDVPEMLELLEQDLTFCGESFETLDQCAFAAEIRALGDVAECAASHTVWVKDTSDSITNEFCLGAVSALRKQRCLHSAQACSMESLADDSGLCGSDRESEYGDEIAQGEN